MVKGGSHALPLVGIAGATGVLLAGLSTSTGAFWLTILWVSWVIAFVWSLTRPSFSLGFAALQAAMLLFVILPGTAAEFGHQTTIGGNNYGGGVAAALAVSALAELGLLVGAVAARSLRPAPSFLKLHPVLSTRRIDRASQAAVGAGIVAIFLLVAVGGANLRDFLVFTTKSGYGSFGGSAAGSKVGYLVAVQTIAGLAFLLIALRWTSTYTRRWISPAVLGLLAAMVLLGQGQRGRFLVPIFAAGIVWLKTSKVRFAPRRLAIAGVFFLLLVASLVGIARGAAGQRNFSVANIVSAPLGSGNDLFLPLAGLAETIPSTHPYLSGSSYLEALVFPIPRALWSGKPTGVISQVTDVFDPGRSGLAFPEFGEMYANFGIAGVLAGSFLLGMLVEGLWSRLSSTKSLRESVLLSVVIAVLLQLFVRGDIAPMLTSYLGLLASTSLLCRRKAQVLSPMSVGEPMVPAKASWR